MDRGHGAVSLFKEHHHVFIERLVDQRDASIRRSVWVPNSLYERINPQKCYVLAMQRYVYTSSILI